MRVFWASMGVLVAAMGAGRAQAQPQMPAGQLVREVI